MSSIAPGFGDVVLHSQSVFRSVMNALARPTSIHPLDVQIQPPAPLSVGAAAVALSLLDFETPVWLDHALRRSDNVIRWLRFHTGAPVTYAPADAAFALFSDAASMPPLSAFASGTMEYPDRSTTLVIQVEHLGSNGGWEFSGPGLERSMRLAAEPLPSNFSEQIAANRDRFPQGVDLLFVTSEAVAAIPRTSRLSEGA